MIWFALFIGGAIGVSWALLPSDMALMITILGVILGGISLYLGWRTEKLIKQMDKESKEMIEEGFKRSREADERVERMIEEGFKRSREADERVERMIEEGWKRVERIIEEGKRETQKMIEEGFKRLEIFLNETNRMIEEGRMETREILREIQRTQGDIARILEKMDEKVEHRELMGR